MEHIEKKYLIDFKEDLKAFQQDDLKTNKTDIN